LGYTSELKVCYCIGLCEYKCLVTSFVFGRYAGEEHPGNQTYSRSPRDQTLRKHKMKLNPMKCAFGVSSGKFLRFMVSQRGIEVNPEKVKVVLNMQAPRNTK